MFHHITIAITHTGIARRCVIHSHSADETFAGLQVLGKLKNKGKLHPKDQWNTIIIRISGIPSS